MPYWRRETDVLIEAATARRLEAAYAIRVQHNTAPYAPLDFTFFADQYKIGAADLKNRSHHHGKHPTVYLSVRKYQSLLTASHDNDVALFLVRYLDGSVWWIDVLDVDPTQVSRLGRFDRPSAVNDVEPIIEVPVPALRRALPPG